MKNKYLSIIIAVLVGMFLTACESYLEEMPQNKLKPSTTDDYAQLLNKGYVTGQVVPYLDILSDDVDLIAADHVMPGTDNGDVYISAYMWQDHHEASMLDGDKAFEKFYESIFYCNVVIENIDKASGVELNEVNVERTRKNIKGEAYVLRAYSYFYLVNLYAVPYNPETCTTDPGMPITKSTSAEDKAYTRNTVKEVYDLIVDDLLEGIKLMEVNPIKKEAKLKFDALSAKALLARVYLYMQDWDNAIKYAEEVIKENPAIFNLYEAGTKLNMENNSGTSWNATNIWGKDYLSKDNDNVIFVNGINELMPAMSYWLFITTFSVNKDLARQFETGDVRRFYFMQTYSRDTYAGYRTKLSYAKNRYIGLTYTMQDSRESGYTRVIRIEEMYLILAEAYAHKTDGMKKAVDYLNTLRVEKFREGEYTPLKVEDFNQNTLLEFVMKERRLELCFEGHRWFDLRRTTRPAMERVGYNNETARLEKNDPRYVLQIPKRELSVNPAIGSNPR